LQELWLQLLNGLFVGLSLALVAAGLALVFGVLRIVNFAQGELVMLGAYALVITNQITGSFAVATVVSVVTAGVGGGLLMYALLKPLQGRSPVLSLLATLGLSLILRQLAVQVFGGFIRTVDQPIHLGIPVAGLQYPVYDLLIALASVIALSGGYLFLQRARFGIWLRAAVDNSAMAAALGVPLPRVYLVAFILSAGLSALAGALLAPVTAVYATLGQDVAVNAFIVVVAGGLGNFNFRGVALFALILGEIQAVGSIWFRPVAVQVFAIALVTAVLVVRSRGRPVFQSLYGGGGSLERPTWWPMAAAGVGVAALAPLVLGGGSALQQAGMVLVFTLLAAAVAVLLRVGGVLNVGIGVIFGASAYAVALLSRADLAPGWLLAGALLAACVPALAYGLYASVASGIEYMMLTFLTTAAVSKLPIVVPGLSGGANGLEVRNVAHTAFGLDPLDGPGFYLLSLLLACVSLAIGWFVLSSQTGRVAAAAGRNPLRVASNGYSLGVLRTLVALLAGVLAGLAGWMYSAQARVIGQDVLGLEVSLNSLTYALIGGVAQPILGSALGTSLAHLVSTLFGRSGSGSSSLLVGVALLVVVYVLPNGVLGLSLPLARRDRPKVDPPPAREPAALPVRARTP
jgi:branched-subunit amino acid ABC-type transport system permease component